ncbi:metallophosphoesterase [Metabacillus endolithicus]|uniref:Metallophosphoesterase n=1 Tax=Metabacillus endolithicus TaxID=1535204 RepID=A0ABW5BV38_9BACI|nr:metallophosphoesterase [Metabacillus endolithicus]UPG64490.1 metallophosphoesterase [Metabacillus endolithicus]
MTIRKKKILFVCLLFIITALVFYIVWDNNRINVVKKDVYIEELDSSLDGFKILQITDLHEKSFGEDQENLINEINALDYDAIIFTGDMLIRSNSTDYSAFFKLIEGIHNKENALFVSGNSDPENYVYNSEGKVEKHKFIKGMEERGVKLLESIHTINYGDARVQFVNFELSIIGPKIERSLPLETGKLPDNLEYRKELVAQLNNNLDDNPSSILIALNHYPVVDVKIDYLKNHDYYIFRDYDLIMAGHYHGGQIRLPFLGVLFVPEPYYERSGLFPPQNRVKGLWEYDGIKQYVSTGLGSSDTISFLKFRFFNTPEINLITLKRKG